LVMVNKFSSGLIVGCRERQWQTWPPNLHKMISERVVKNNSVPQALYNRAWVADIKGALTVQVLVEYLHRDLVDDMSLQP
jgi:hypothetical protein